MTSVSITTTAYPLGQYKTRIPSGRPPYWKQSGLLLLPHLDLNWAPSAPMYGLHSGTPSSLYCGPPSRPLFMSKKIRGPDLNYIIDDDRSLYNQRSEIKIHAALCLE